MNEDVLSIRWNLNDFPKEGIDEGEYTAYTILPEGYKMADGLDDPSVTVVITNQSIYTIQWMGTSVSHNGCREPICFHHYQ